MSASREKAPEEVAVKIAIWSREKNCPTKDRKEDLKATKLGGIIFPVGILETFSELSGS